MSGTGSLARPSSIIRDLCDVDLLPPMEVPPLIMGPGIDEG